MIKDLVKFITEKKVSLLGMIIGLLIMDIIKGYPKVDNTVSWVVGIITCVYIVHYIWNRKKK